MHGPGDDPATALPHAPLSLAVVDFEDVLKISQFAVCLPVIAQGGAARFDRFLEHVADRLGDGGRGAGGGAAGVRQDAGFPGRREAGAKQGLARINVAQAGNAFLIEQSRLERRASAGEQFRQEMGVEAGPQRFARQPAQPRVVRERPARRRDP